MPHRISRREYFGTAVANAAAGRGHVRAGTLGDIRFCRISDHSLRDAALAIAGRDVVVEVDSSATGVTLLGSRATWVLDHDGSRLFSPDAL